PKAFGMVSVLMGALAIMPGMPFLPFAIFSAASGFAAWRMSKKAAAKAALEKAVAAQEQAQAAVVEQPISQTLAIDAVRIEIGYA
ncbi:FHIPEP family type III secretion protein, partial [Enterobacter cloacae]|uniref:FHIPEP family type III secretion protein n=2 Tax=Pseudomonadota TaxID=1224 RepID=UPI0019531399